METYGDIQRNTPEEEQKYYVYMWYEEVDGKIIPIYVGMGSGNRWKTKTARSKITAEYLKSHDCKSMILVKNLAWFFAYKVEQEVKKEVVRKGFKLFDGEHDKTQRKQRQRKAIDEMPVVNGKRVSLKTGNHYGRPKKEIKDFPKYLEQQKSGLITVDKACAELGIARTQWYRLAGQVELRA